jgi:hypothetical protein
MLKVKICVPNNNFSIRKFPAYQNDKVVHCASVSSFPHTVPPRVNGIPPLRKFRKNTTITKTAKQQQIQPILFFKERAFY